MNINEASVIHKQVDLLLESLFSWLASFQSQDYQKGLTKIRQCLAQDWPMTYTTCSWLMAGHSIQLVALGALLINS